MELNPQRVRNAEFKSVKRGVDPDEVRRFLDEVADALENAQNQSTAMEARARAAVARLQELSEDASSQATAARSDDAAATAEQAETISRTLLLAQRTADTAIAQAEAESQRLVAAATEEAAATLDSTREMAARLMEEAREEARKVGEAERLAVASEVDSLKARRDFLESDVDHLEQFLAMQRGRLRDAAAAMIDLTERVDDGLAEVRRPLLSAADDEADATDATPAGEPATGDVGGADPEWAGGDAADDVTGHAATDAAGDAAADDGSADGAADHVAADPVAADPVAADPVAADQVGAADEPVEGGSGVADVDGSVAFDAGDAGRAGVDETAIGPIDDGTPPGAADTEVQHFVLDDVTGDEERPAANENIRFSFDDRR